MKSPPVQYADHDAHAFRRGVIKGDIERELASNQ